MDPGDIWKAVKTIESAFEFDPFVLYMKAVSLFCVNLHLSMTFETVIWKDDKAPRAQSRLQNFIFLALVRIREVVLTVEAGTALIVV